MNSMRPNVSNHMRPMKAQTLAINASHIRYQPGTLVAHTVARAATTVGTIATARPGRQVSGTVSDVSMLRA
ncbi:hypothetical protein GCM10027187_75250 [Streptosporangium sandarakinum]